MQRDSEPASGAAASVRRWGIPFTAAVALAAAFYALNPHWYMDAVNYAENIAEGELWMDSGHLLWRPLGALTLGLLRPVWPTAGPLESLRLLSSLSAGFLCVLTYRLAIRLELDRSRAFVAAGLLAVTQAVVAYGGSGSSYIAAAMFGMLALLCFVRPDREWSKRDAAIGVASFAVAWGFWGPLALSLPGLTLAAYLYSQGSPPRRARRAVQVAVSGAACILGLLVLGYGLASPELTFPEWMRGASHGIPMELSIIGAARAGYGILIAFAHLGAAGRSVKAMLLGSGGAEDLGQLLLLSGTILMAAALTAFAAWGLWRAAGRKPVRRWLPTFLGLALPFLLFGLLWQGSDVERFTPILAPLAVTLVLGIAELEPRLPRAARALPALALGGLLVLNSLTFVAPRRFGEEAMTWHLGRSAVQHVEEGSLLVMTGQDLWGAVAASTEHFWDLSVFSVHFIAGFYGVEESWRRLCDRIHDALAAGHSVAVLSDLLGEPTPGGIGLVESEYPEPSMEELQAFFADWAVVDTWRAGRFEFRTLVPPPEGTGCSMVAQGAGSGAY
ncbi:MAG: hypothetical protein R3266_09320 [Gemmatimonadota bacterium]|nr:hypothetical protein [Gemmatimonadota bacterium]